MMVYRLTIAYHGYNLAGNYDLLNDCHSRSHDTIQPAYQFNVSTLKTNN